MRPLILITSLCLTYGTLSIANATETRTKGKTYPLQVAQNNNLACSIWPAIASTATKAQVEAFLSECKQGIFHRLARARLGELSGADTQTKAPPVVREQLPVESDQDAATLYKLAKDHQYGQSGRPKDYQKAFQLFKQAANKGHKKSMTDVGWMSENGLGTPKNLQTAFKWYKKAADLGESMALNNLGWMYTQGKAVALDYNKAVRLYRRAIALGEPLAMTNLGWMYETGKGVKLNNKEAFSLYKQAADAGDLQGLHNTGWMYATGRGTNRSPVKAASAVYSALRNGNQFSIDQMTNNYTVWPEDFRKEIQKLLSKNGYYSGPKDGKFTNETIDAIRKAAND